MARFAQFAMAATEEALEDAAWRPNSPEQLEATVRHSLLANFRRDVLFHC